MCRGGDRTAGAFDDAALGKYRDAFVANCPLDVDQPLHYPDGEHAELDPDWVRRLTRLLVGAMADGEHIAAAFEAARPGVAAVARADRQR